VDPRVDKFVIGLWVSLVVFYVLEI
jgi:hypothetical protein